jgi:2-methylcitrate dehydratase PrpD
MLWTLREGLEMKRTIRGPIEASQAAETQQHMVAIMLLDKTVTFASVHDRARMQDPDVLRQRAKVEVVSDPRIDARRPRREAIVELSLTDGTQLSAWVRDV